MAFFPKIQRPCPYRTNLAAVMDGDFCTMCSRNVFDLTGMDDEGRRAFLAGCGSDEVCVSYRIPRAALAASMLAAAAIPAGAAAQESGPAVPYAAAIAADQAAATEDVAIIVGGIRDPAHTEMVDVRTDANVPELPVVYEDKPRPARPAAPTVAPAAADSMSG